MKKSDEFDNIPNEFVGESLRIQDVTNFFMYDNNPALTETLVEKKAVAMAKREGGIPLPLIIAVAIVFVAGAIGYTMINGNNKQNEFVNKYVSCQQQLTQKCAPVVTQQPQIPSSTEPNIPIAIK